MKNYSNSSILICDNDSTSSQWCIREMKLRGLSPVVFEDADDCIAYFNKGNQVSLVILDIMLPSKNAYSKQDTYDYVYTGLFLAQDIRKKTNSPIIFFSNISFTNQLSKVQTAMNSIGNCALIKKYKMETTEDFGEIVDKAITGGIRSVTRMSLLKIISKYIVLQPSIGIASINLNAILKDSTNF